MQLYHSTPPLLSSNHFIPSPSILQALHPSPPIFQLLHPSPTILPLLQPSYAILQPLHPSSTILQLLHPSSAILQALHPSPSILQPLHPSPSILQLLHPSPSISKLLHLLPLYYVYAKVIWHLLVYREGKGKYNLNSALTQGEEVENKIGILHLGGVPMVLMLKSILFTKNLLNYTLS